MVIHSTIWKTLEYPLTCTLLTEKQCEQIMRSTMSAGLTKSHICRFFPMSIIHAGAEALGSELPHLFTVQGIKWLSTLVSHSPWVSIMSLLFLQQRKQRFWRLDVVHLHGTLSSIQYYKSSPRHVQVQLCHLWHKTALIFTTTSG
jgi:hypothetical protein